MSAKDTLQSGRQVSITTTDGTDVATQTITVRQIRVSEMGAYCALTDDLARLAMVTGLRADQIDQLTLDAYEALLVADEEVNAPFARRHLEREARKVASSLDTLRTQAPEMYQQIQDEMQAQYRDALGRVAQVPTLGAALSDSSPTPVSPVA